MRNKVVGLDELDLHRVSVHSQEKANSNSGTGGQVFSINIPQVKKNWGKIKSRGTRNNKKRLSDVSNQAANITTISKFFKEPSDLGNMSAMTNTFDKRSTIKSIKRSKSPMHARNTSLKKRKIVSRLTPHQTIAQMKDKKLRLAQDKIVKQNVALNVLKEQLTKQMKLYTRQ
jgi:hypothetical protein